jgi:hypothetical protein
MLMAVPPGKVGEVAVRQTLKGKMIIVPGTLARVTSGVVRFLPRGVLASVYGSLGEQ